MTGESTRPWLRGPLPYALLLLAAVNVLVHFWHASLVREREANLLRSMPAAGDDAPARWDRSTGERLEEYLPRIPDATKAPLVIVAGMSQMYAVNDPKPGDRTVSERLDDALAPSGARAFGLAAPNMNNEEALLLLLKTAGDPKTRPGVFLYGVCFDKFRNVDLRPAFRRLLRNDASLAARWREAADRYRERYPLAAAKLLASLPAAEAAGREEEATVEKRLRDAAARAFPLVAARQELNAFLMLRLFELRNFVFRITPQTKRPVLAARYEVNREMLRLIRDEAKRLGVRPAFYVIPLNPLAENPYVPAQYEAFKRWLREDCEAEGVPFANLEDVVPSRHWGEFMGGPDFKHFRGEGHEITAAALMEAFGPILSGGRAAR